MAAANSVLVALVDAKLLELGINYDGPTDGITTTLGPGQIRELDRILRASYGPESGLHWNGTALTIVPAPADIGE